MLSTMGVLVLVIRGAITYVGLDLVTQPGCFSAGLFCVVERKDFE